MTVPACTNCGTTIAVLTGMNKGKQLYKCKSRHRRYGYIEPEFSKKLYTSEVTCEALNMIMSCMSYRKAAEHLNYTNSASLSHNTIIDWVNKYTVIVKAYMDALSPIIGKVLSIDEAYINVRGVEILDGKGYGNWLWTAIDPKMRIDQCTIFPDQQATYYFSGKSLSSCSRVSLQS